jgi:hypothetical protein
LSRMLKEMSIRRRLNLPDIFKGLRLKGETDHSRVPYETDFIQKRLLANGALAGLNEDARLVLWSSQTPDYAHLRSSICKRIQSC